MARNLQERVIPIEHAIIDESKKASDHEWMGDLDKADILWKEVDRLIKLQKNGEKYYVLF